MLPSLIFIYIVKEKREDSGETVAPTVAAPTTCVAATPLLYPPSIRFTVLASDHIVIGSVGVITSQEALSGWSCLGRNSVYCPVFQLMADADLEEVDCLLYLQNRFVLLSPSKKNDCLILQMHVSYVNTQFRKCYN